MNTTFISDNKALLKIGWFSTGRGEGSYGLLESTLNAIDSGELHGEVTFVFVNRAEGQTKQTDRFLTFVKSRGIPLITLSSRDFRRAHNNEPWANLREAFDKAVIELLSPFDADIAVHAGYMLIAPVLCSEYLTLNLHPALPGSTIGMWQQAIWDVIGKRLIRTGAMIHVSTINVDEGPVIATAEFSVRGRHFDSHWEEIDGFDLKTLKQKQGEELGLFKAIRKAGLLRERPLLVETLKAVSQGQIDPTGSKGIADLTQTVEKSIMD